MQVGDKVRKGQKIGDGEGLCVPVHASVSGTVIAVEPRPHTSGRMVNAVVIENDFRNESVPADGEGLCVPVHASVSGTVIAVEPRPHTSGRMVNAVVIENDFRNESVPAQGMEQPLEQLDADAVLHAIREAGIVGMGGAAFPGNVKAVSSMGHIDTLIANACECEPYITADDSLLRTKAEQVLQGMMILRQVLSPERVVLAVEDNPPTTPCCGPRRSRCSRA